MRISREADYAIRILLYLSGLESGAKTGAKAISETMHIPERFNLKILRKLTVEGITKSYRGVYGGYALAQPARSITLLDAIECIDGPVGINRCLTDPEFCSRHSSENCPVHGCFAVLNERIQDSLREISFYDLVQDQNQKDHAEELIKPVALA